MASPSHMWRSMPDNSHAAPLVGGPTRAIDVVLSGDRRVLWGLAVTGRSALESTSAKLNIHILETGFSDRDKNDLVRSWQHPMCGSISFYNVPSADLRKFRSTRYLKSKSAYSRYFLSMLPSEAQRCIYLDADLLVLRDLAESRDLSPNAVVAAVPDVSVRTREAWPELRARLKLVDELRYFNSGVLIINLEAWRDQQIESKLIKTSIEKFDILDSQDQDALNIVLHDKVDLIDVSWNVSQYERPMPMDGNIVHLIGSVKPWHARYSRKQSDPYFTNHVSRTFYDILDRTAYAGRRPVRLAGLAAFLEQLNAWMPTRDMLFGKIRRHFRNLNSRFVRS